MGKVIRIEDFYEISDLDALYKIVEEAQNRSINARETIRNAKRFYLNIKDIHKIIMPILLTAALSVNAIDEVEEVNEKLPKVPKRKYDSQVISNNESSGSKNPTIVDERVKSIKSIVDLNTEGNGTTFYFKHDGIAKDLLKLDNNIFEYAFYNVCKDMGTNLYNNVGVGGRSNIDSVIFYLNLYSRIEGPFFNKYVANLFENVSSLDDFLIKRGYVDRKGEPSLDVFKKVCERQTEDILSNVQGRGSNI